MTRCGYAEFPADVTLASNFGTFLLYALSCIICMVAYTSTQSSVSCVTSLSDLRTGRQHRLHACLSGGSVPWHSTKAEPLLALGIALVWAIYGGLYFVTTSRSTGRSTLVGSRA